MPLPQMIIDRYARLREWYARNAQVADVLYPKPASLENVRILCFGPDAAVNLGQANYALYLPDRPRGRMQAQSIQKCMNDYNETYGPPPEYPMPEYLLYEPGSQSDPPSGAPPRFHLPVILVRCPPSWLDDLQDAEVNFRSAMVPLHEMGHALLGLADPKHQGEPFAYWIEVRTILRFVETTVPSNGSYANPLVGITTTAQAIANYIVGRAEQFGLAVTPDEREVRSTGLPDTIDRIAATLQAAGLPEFSVTALNQQAARLRQLKPSVTADRR
ncbi:hypothetical protein [Kitasatospora sp. NPDC057541]|uniref:hypothetical protein n=1 Tax=unclassified Kitasatospora TaxID=2633591 RepID=UPI0036BC85BC